MPEISRFFGMVIIMHWKEQEHNPPHFHAVYGDDEAIIDINKLELISGKLSRRALTMVLEWAKEHRDELLKDWELCQNNQKPNKIEPLQ
ncbi:MAG: DUF4160 domain-containing protein [Burkholderiales bacterium]|nr:DUF4160 domain-containing protein [Burkholderiales bacterium]